MEKRQNAASALFWIVLSAFLLILTLTTLFTVPGKKTRAENAVKNTAALAENDPFLSVFLAVLDEGGSIRLNENGASRFALAVSDGAASVARAEKTAFSDEAFVFSADGKAYLLPAENAFDTLSGAQPRSRAGEFAAAAVLYAQKEGVYADLAAPFWAAFGEAGTEKAEIPVDGDRETATILRFSAEDLKKEWDEFFRIVKTEKKSFSALSALFAAARGFCGESASLPDGFSRFLTAGEETESASGTAAVTVYQNRAAALQFSLSLQRGEKWEIEGNIGLKDTDGTRKNLTLVIKRTSSGETSTLRIGLSDLVTENSDDLYRREIDFIVSDPGGILLNAATEFNRKETLRWVKESGEFSVDGSVNGTDHALRGTVTQQKTGKALSIRVSSLKEKGETLLSGAELTAARETVKVVLPENAENFIYLSPEERAALFAAGGASIEPETAEEPSETQG